MKTRSLLALALTVVVCAIHVTAQIAPRVVQSSVNQINLYVLPTGVRDVVTIAGSLPAGDAAARRGNVAIATLVGEMLDQGTTRQDKFTIADQLESVGAELSFSVGNDTLNISGRCLKKDLPVVLSLLFEQLREPAFNAEDLERVKTRLIGGLQRSLESTSAIANEAFNNAIYPVDHPNYQTPVKAFIAAVGQATLDELKTFHASHYGPDGLQLVLVGDVAADQVETTIRTATTGWTGGSAIIKTDVAATELTDRGTVVNVNVADKTSVNIAWGQASGLHYTDEDSLALDVGTAILGQGFTGRLLAKIRDQEGLTYGIGANATNDTYNDGEWYIKGTFAPELLEQGIASTRRELEAWYNDGVTAKELAERKTNLIGTFKLQLATTGGLAQSILRAVQRGDTLESLDTYPDRIEALTLQEVNRAIKRHLNPADMVLVRAGTLPGASN
ncbi:M16 family metallopeptidase [Synoicihabitans lomoniglobus]|uniref:Pitrilysin family protein n=1 Tax=Synoicihabitans lomoniglobus TaxID=2909285 RepID=A0AAE9ZUA3_9BACT|nr:insulinase family protein [Opitutaceae bacterium LMO-M01]WED65280.1 pitrilysin family protein [Opitutaceae bacterium LMO-M01]